MNEEYFIKVYEQAKSKENSARENWEWAKTELAKAELNLCNTENKENVYCYALEDLNDG